MKTITLSAAALALSAPAVALTAAPAAAATNTYNAVEQVSHYSPSSEQLEWNHGRKDKRWKRGRNYDRNYDRYNSYGRGYYDEPVYRNTRVWRGDDGRTYCRKKDGTTGLIIGGAAGALLGREIDSRGDRTLGTVLGAAAGALLGREVERGGSRCR